MRHPHRRRRRHRPLLRHPTLGTAVSYILIENSGQRHFLVYGDLNDILTDQDVPDELLKQADIVYFGSAMAMHAMDSGGAAALFRKARALGKMTVADTSTGLSDTDHTYWLPLLSPMLRETDLFVPSYDEAALITGKQELADIRDVLFAHGVRHLVIKLGSRGCYLSDPSGEHRVPAFDAFSPVDTTGAGDSFVGGLIRGLLLGWSLDAAAVFASAVAGFNITRLGATAGVPDFDTAYSFVVRNHPDPTRFPLQ